VDSLTLETVSPEQTERLAAVLAGGLAPGQVALVAGDVGAGKTTFVRGACRALGVRERVTSPSFTIGHVYEGEVPVAHVDLFRLESLDGEDPGLLADYLSPEQVTFIEWPQAAAPALQPGRVALRVRLEHAGGDRRRCEVQAAPALLARVAA